MASGTANSDSPSVDVAASEQYGRFVEKKLNRARAHVKINDLIAGILALLAGLMIFFLVIAVIDHWIIGLSFSGRLLTLSVFAVGSGFFLARNVLPMLFGRVNPVYAARAIERSRPSLKNSLINFLLFRSDRTALREVVYEAIEKRAAEDLSHLSVDSAVDRTKLINVGYVMVAVLSVCALYFVLSPKNPLQTVQRVLLPWSDIDRPSRIRIESIQWGVLGSKRLSRGDAEIFQGQKLKITANVLGVKDDDEVTLYYTTADSQIVDGKIPLYRPDDALSFACQLPSDNQGIFQALTYRIEAGDAISRDFHVNVSPGPSIVVHSISYEYPDYTKLPSRTTEQESDINALEGTRVTIHARSNREIRSAYLEFDPETIENNGSADKTVSRSKMLPIKQISGERAQVSFLLELNSDRTSPRYSSYQLRFQTVDGFRNEEPILHSIDVMPDLAPRVSILAPQKQIVEVPEDGQLEIRVRAEDPDFALQRVRLEAISESKDILNEKLFDSLVGHVGQKISSYDFSPRTLNLKAGTVLRYWASAEDNRTSAQTGEHQPNISRTEPEYLIRITAAERQNNKESTGTDKNNDQKEQQKSNKASPNQKNTEENSEGQQKGKTDSNHQEQSSAEENKEKNTEKTENKEEPGKNSSNTEHSNPEASNEESKNQESQAAGEDNENLTTENKQQPNDSETGSEKNDPNENGISEEEQRSDKPYDTEGSDDGDIFDTVREHRQEEAEENNEQSTKNQNPEKNDTTSDNEEESNKDDPNSPDAEAGEQQQTESQGDKLTKDTQDNNTPDRSDEESTKESPQKTVSEENSKTGEDEKNSNDSNSTEQKESAEDVNQTEKDRQNGEDAKEDENNNSSRESQDDAERQKNNQAEKTQSNKLQKDPSDNAEGKPDSNSTEENSTEETNDKKSSSQAENSSNKQTNQSNDKNEVKQPGEENSAENKSTKEQNKNNQNPTGKPSTDTGGSSSNTEKPLQEPPIGGDTEDEANLDYAKKATDLVLEYLKNQKNKPDRKLLDKLGWTKEDVQKFVSRWEQMKREAARNDATGRQAQRKLNDALKRLGLHPGRDKLRSGGNRKDKQQGLRDAGHRSDPPAFLLEKYKAFKKGMSRVKGE